MNVSKITLVVLAMGLIFSAPVRAADESSDQPKPKQVGQYVPPTDDAGGYIDVGSEQPAASEADQPEDEETKKELEELKAYVEEIQRSTKAGRDGQQAADAAKTVQQIQQIKNVQQSYKF
ncbi:MAG TPA: hypothetical protein VL688_03405 [Verrucomicrobiae bacterium]|jgi:hypothetical protein|nr:hypothetical protein [Verrucomicrobiae bacterium]